MDLKNRSFTLESINLTFGNTVECKEKMIYSPHPEDPEKTLLVQETAIEVKTMAMTSYLEGVALDNVVPNVQKGRRAIEWVMEEFHNFAKWEEWMHQAVSLTDDVKKLGIRGIRDVEAHVEKVKQNSILLESNPGES